MLRYSFWKCNGRLVSNSISITFNDLAPIFFFLLLYNAVTSKITFFFQPLIFLWKNIWVYYFSFPAVHLKTPGQFKWKPIIFLLMFVVLQLNQLLPKKNCCWISNHHVQRLWVTHASMCSCPSSVFLDTLCQRRDMRGIELPYSCIP